MQGRYPGRRRVGPVGTSRTPTGPTRRPNTFLLVPSSIYSFLLSSPDSVVPAGGVPHRHTNPLLMRVLYARGPRLQPLCYRDAFRNTVTFICLRLLASRMCTRQPRTLRGFSHPSTPPATSTHSKCPGGKRASPLVAGGQGPPNTPAPIINIHNHQRGAEGGSLGAPGRAGAQGGAGLAAAPPPPGHQPPSLPRDISLSLSLSG